MKGKRTGRHLLKMGTEKHNLLMASGTLAFDVALIGTEPECFFRAIKLARAGQHVALITNLPEDEPVESFYPLQELILQSLYASAERAQAFRTSGQFGILETRPEIGWHSVKIHISDTLDRIAPHYSRERLAGLGVQIFDAPVKTTGDKTITLENDITLHIQTHETFHTIHETRMPQIKGADTITPLRLDDILEWDDLPETLTILGGGAHALSLAQSLTRLGCQCNILSSGAALEGYDPALYKMLYDTLEKERIRIIEHVSLSAVTQDEDKITLHMEHQDATRRLSAEEILVLDTGDHRSPDTSGTQTCSILCDPPLAETGMNEQAAREKYGAGNFHIIKWRAQDTVYGRTRRQNEGILKIITRIDGRVIGASIFGAQAQELIAFWSLAIAAKLRLQDMRETDAPLHSHSFMNSAAIMGYLEQINAVSPEKPLPLWRRLLKS